MLLQVLQRQPPPFRRLLHFQTFVDQYLLNMALNVSWVRAVNSKLFFLLCYRSSLQMLIPHALVLSQHFNEIRLLYIVVLVGLPWLRSMFFHFDSVHPHYLVVHFKILFFGSKALEIYAAFTLSLSLVVCFCGTLTCSTTHNICAVKQTTTSIYFGTSSCWHDRSAIIMMKGLVGIASNIFWATKDR